MSQDTFEQIARNIFNSMYGFISVDNDGIITFISESYANNLGRTQDECIGQPVDEIIPNTRLKLVLQRKKPELGRYTKTVDNQKPGSICSRLLIYRDGIADDSNVVGAMAYGIITNSKGWMDYSHLAREIDVLRGQNEMYQSHLSQVYQAEYDLDEILGSSQRVQAMKTLIRRVANTAVSVCILGETGTGKELVANAIHKLSRRAAKPFIKINCAAIPKELLESELFGYEPGAFTGAARQGKIGKFELANGGTLLLDEIGEMPLNLQAKLLRVLQAGEVERVGGTAPIPIDVRFLCSTNRDLQQMIQAGTFRADLYYRINTMEITVPPLRERPEDIPDLAAFFVEKANRRNDLAITGISPQVYGLLRTYSWPGNIRELEHSIERACVLRGQGMLECAQFASLTGDPAAPMNTPAAQPDRPDAASLRSKTSSMELEMIRQALDECRGNKKAAAEKLGITRATLYSKLKKYGIN